MNAMAHTQARSSALPAMTYPQSWPAATQPTTAWYSRMPSRSGGPSTPVLFAAGAMSECPMDEGQAVEYIGLAAQRAAVQANGWSGLSYSPAVGARGAAGKLAGNGGW